jgi:hypothetical protein
MEPEASDGLVRARELTIGEVVFETPIEDLDQMLPMLKRHARDWNVCALILDRIEQAPLSEYSGLMGLYHRHCAGKGSDDSKA